MALITEPVKSNYALDPQAVWARQNLALCLEKLGRREEAIAELKHALALKPKYGTGWLALGQLYEQMGRTNDAQLYATATEDGRELQVSVAIDNLVKGASGQAVQSMNIMCGWPETDGLM